MKNTFSEIETIHHITIQAVLINFIQTIRFYV